MIRNDARCTLAIKSRILMAKALFNKMKNLLTTKLKLDLRNNVIKCCIWNTTWCGAETWTFRNVNRKYLKTFEMWCSKRIQKINWTDSVRNEEALSNSRGGAELCTLIKGRKATWSVGI